MAEVARPHGVRGELRLRPFNADSRLLAARSKVTLRAADGAERAVVLATVREVPKALLVTIQGVSSRDDAEALRGMLVCVDRADFPELEEGEFYACDVEGAEVVLAGGERVGTVRELRSYPTCEVLVVDRGGREVEVPLVDAYVAGVDPAARRVTLVTLEGLD